MGNGLLARLPRGRVPQVGRSDGWPPRLSAPHRAGSWTESRLQAGSPSTRTQGGPGVGPGQAGRAPEGRITGRRPRWPPRPPRRFSRTCRASIALAKGLTPPRRSERRAADVPEAAARRHPGHRCRGGDGEGAAPHGQCCRRVDRPDPERGSANRSTAPSLAGSPPHALAGYVRAPCRHPCPGVGSTTDAHGIPLAVGSMGASPWDQWARSTPWTGGPISHRAGRNLSPLCQRARRWARW